MTLTTRRSFLAGLFVAPAIIVAPNLMRVSSAAFDFWVRYQTWPDSVPRPEDYQVGHCPYRRLQEMRGHLLRGYGGLEWAPAPTPLRDPVTRFRLMNFVAGCPRFTDHWATDETREEMLMVTPSAPFIQRDRT